MKNLKKILSHWCWRLLAHSPCSLVPRSRIRLTSRSRMKSWTLWLSWWSSSKVSKTALSSPTQRVTRAQMAKMIYVLRTGNSDASAYNDDKTSFTDIGSHWARGYIKYCQSLGHHCW